MPLRALQANRFVRFVPLLIAYVPCMAWSQQAHPNAFADTILTNAHVWTVDDAEPEAEAIAIGGTKILFVGSKQGSAALSRTIDEGAGPAWGASAAGLQ
jgi:hypothetical protein